MKSTLKLIVTAAILLSVCCSSAFSQQVAKTIPNSTSPDGLIGFLQFTPSDYGSQKHPLIIFLHGIGERGNGTSQINNVTANAIPKFCAAKASMRFTVNGQTSSFVVLSPQLSNSYGYWPTFYVKEMIKYAKANLQIDPNRIYITGLSLGGGGVWRALTEVTDSYYGFPGEIAAAAPVCGTQEEIDANMCSTIAANNLPIWNFHCMDDGTVGVGASQHAEILLSRCTMSPTPKFTYYQSGGHGGAWTNAFDTGHITTPVVVNGVVTSFTANPNIYEWMLGYSRNSSAPTYRAPVASAGNAQTITLPTSSVTLSGNGTGTNGASISSYAWVKTSGPSSGSIASSGSASTSVTGLSQGTYVFTLTVTDNHGLTNSSSVTITVNSAYTAPTANAGSAQTITLPTSSVTLSGSGTGTNGASISSYAWAKTSGPSSGSVTTTNAASTTATGLAQGSYVFTLTVTDNHGMTNSSSATITVNPSSGNSGTPSTEQPIGYVKIANGSYQACADASTSGRTAVYGSGIANGGILYTDAAHTQVFNGGWNWYSYSPTSGGQVTMAFAVYPNGSINLLSYCTAGLPTSTPPTTTPTTPPPTTPTTPGTLLGYVKTAGGSYQGCADASSSNRIAVYGISLVNGSILYTDAALTQVYNGGWSWYSFTPTLGGLVTYAFAIFPDGSINMLVNCAGGVPVPPPTTTPTTPPAATPIGYIKMSVGPYQACDDKSTDNRIAVYGTSIANGTILYTDAAKTQVYNGGWNWFSVTPTLGGSVSQTFAIYPTGGIFLLRSCSNPGGRTAASGMPATTVEKDIATLKRLKEAAEAGTTNSIPGGKAITVYPNPVSTTATIQFYSTTNSLKTISVYDSKGVLHGKYTVSAIQGNNTMPLKNADALNSGLYIVDVRDNNGKAEGTVKFIKVK